MTRFADLVDAPFGGLAISFKQLLYNLEHVCGCIVKLVDPGGIPDTDQSVSGALYQVSRAEKPDQFTHIEVYSEKLPVLPDHLATICVHLDLPISRVLGNVN